MRTTLDLDDALAREAKKRAADEGTSLTKVIEEALRGHLAVEVRRGDFRLDLPVVEGRRSPAVDVADRDALYDVLDRDA